MASGALLEIPVHIIAGAEEGPTLALIATQHGEELGPLSVFRSLLQEINPQVLRGNVLVVPVANPIAFEHQQRATWIDAFRGGTTGNLNRLWPGKPRGFITERMAYAIAENVLRRSDCVIDYHGSTTGAVSIYYSYMMPQDGSALATRCRDLVLAFGMEIIMARPVRSAGPGDTTLCDFVYRELKVPAFPVELGEFYGFEDEPGRAERVIPLRTIPEVGITGTLNVMMLLGMIAGRKTLPRKQVIVSPETRCQPYHGGLLEPLVTRKDIGRVFAKNTPLGRVLSPTTFEILGEIQAPYDDNILVSASDSIPYSRVNPGDQGFHVADYSTAEWILNG